ncbi:MAG TPA: type II toxin-antitoxin system HicA family toxin [Candidatus Kapabacteria bacterium]|nr:type II toxin-antitoxin system HicA family toxin [Candidatus Kapabacteria bacterium]HET6402539.1 type II toxin-antitoxin system HicA family toxin [Candidatus Kapabacteria bacterium]
MPHLGPIKRKDLIAALRKAGFHGPNAGGKHDYMLRDNHAVTIPNPHGRDISEYFLRDLLKQAGISREEWETL